MFDNVNAALEEAHIELDDTQLNAVFEEASFEFSLEDEEMVTMLSAQEGLERDLEQLDRIEAVLESEPCTEGLMKYINTDGQLAATIGVEIPVVTTENAAAVSQACLEGIKNTMVRIWEAIKRFFAGLIIRVKAWFKRVLAFRGALEKKLTAAKNTMLQNGAPKDEKWREKEVNTYKADVFKQLLNWTSEAASKMAAENPERGAVVDDKVKEFVKNVMGREFKSTDAGKVSFKDLEASAAKELNARTRRSGSLKELGYDYKTISDYVEAALNLVSGPLKKMEGIEAKLVKAADKNVKNAEQAMRDAGAQKDTKDVVEARKAAKDLSGLTTVTTAVYRKGIELGNAALSLANKVPSGK